MRLRLASEAAAGVDDGFEAVCRTAARGHALLLGGGGATARFGMSSSAASLSNIGTRPTVDSVTLFGGRAGRAGR
jgi:hypothetical protein